MKARVFNLQFKNIYFANVLIGIFVMLVGLYTYFFMHTAISIHEGNRASEKIKILNSSVSELEHIYIGATNKIDINLAYEMGFRDDFRAAAYIFRGNRVTALLNNHNEL